MREIGEYLKLIYNSSATITKLRKADIKMDCGVTINTAAMSMLNVIDMNKELTVTDLGKRMRLTKGAVSQMLTKLCKLGLTKKEQYDGNEKKIYPVLTEAGKVAVNEYREKHQDFYSGMEDLLRRYSKENCDMIFQFLKEFDEFSNEFAGRISTGKYE